MGIRKSKTVNPDDIIDDADERNYWNEFDGKASNDVSDMKKARFLNGILRDYILVFTDKELKRIKLIENLDEDENAGFTPIHAAAKFNSALFMEAIISRTKHLDDSILRLYINMVDSYGYSPALYAAENDSAEALAFLLDTELVDMKILDPQGKSLESLCFRPKKCFDIWDKFKNKNLKVTTHTKTHSFDPKSIAEEFQALLINHN